MAGNHPVFLVRTEGSCAIVCLSSEPSIKLIAFTACLCNGQRAGGPSFAWTFKSGPLTTTSLDDFIDARLGRNYGSDMHQSGPSGPDVRPPEDVRSRSARIRAFRAQRQAHKQRTSEPPKQPASLRAIHLLGAEEVKSLFRDVTAGLAFLVWGRPSKGFWILTIVQAR